MNATPTSTRGTNGRPAGDILPDDAVGLPHNDEAERAIIGTLTLDARAIEQVHLLVPTPLFAAAQSAFEHPNTPQFSEPLFFSRALQIVFGCILSLDSRGETVGLQTIAAALEERGVLDAVGGSTYIAGLDDGVFDISQISSLIPIIVRHWKSRALIRLAQRAAQDAGNGRFDDALGAIEKEIAIIKQVDAGSRRGILTLNAEELFNQQTDSDESYIGDHVVSPGAITLFVGPQGIGKSRDAMQLVTESLIGASHWMRALPIHRHDLRWLLFQTENSSHRMNRELRIQLKHTTKDQRQRVIDNFRFTLPTSVEDRILPLNDAATVDRLSATVQQFQPDVIICDPYIAFFGGENENDSIQTRDTVNAMIRVSQAGKPDVAIIIVHHSRSGRTAAAGAVGWDKSGYARGSKALSAIARAQVNIAPGDADDPDLLVVSCGKCSDGRPFETFAVRLDPETMLYRHDPNFDLEGWRDEVQSASGRKGGKGQKVTPELIDLAVRECGGAGKRSVIVERIRVLTNCGLSVAYEALRKRIEGGALLSAAGIVSLPGGPIR